MRYGTSKLVDADVDDVLLVNCAECGRELRGKRSPYHGAWERMCGYFDGRPYCTTCLCALLPSPNGGGRDSGPSRFNENPWGDKVLRELEDGGDGAGDLDAPRMRIV